MSVSPSVQFTHVAREWRCKWSEESDKKTLESAQAALEGITSNLKAIKGIHSVQRIVCGGCHDFKIITTLPAAAFGEWGEQKFAPEEAFLAKLKGAGCSTIETQTYTIMTLYSAEKNSDKNPMTTISPSVQFTHVAREWRCKWSEESDKKTLESAQAALEGITSDLKATKGIHSVQRIVCGGCHDFKIITALPAAAFGEWEKQKFGPEEAFLAKLKEAGCSTIETQTYTITEIDLE